MVGFLTHNSAEAGEPKRIVIAGGDSFKPLIFLNSDGKPDGMYVDLWRLWSEKTGVEVELRLMDWDKTIPALLAGEVDAVDGVTFTPERAKFLDLSDSYAELPSYIYFHESIGGVRGLAELEGFPVGVIGGSHVEDLLRNEAPKLRPITYVNYEEIVQAAIQGRLRVFIGEDPMIPFLFAKMGHRITFRRTEEPIISSDMRTAVRKGDTELLALIERGHRAVTPAEQQSIRDKWAGVSLTSPIPWRWLIGGVAVLFTGIAFLLIWNTQLQKRVAAATRTIRKSEERLRSFTSALPDLAFLLDEDGKYLEVLTAEEQLLYKDLSDVKNSYIHEILPSDVAERSLEIIQKTIATGKTQIYEYKLDFPTGVRWFEARMSPMIETSGDKRMVTCIARDITDRKKAEELLLESQERFRELAELLPETVYEMDATGNLTFVNRKAFEQFGYTQQDLDLGLNCLNMIIPDDRRRAMENISMILGGENPGLQEYTALKKDGTTFPALLQSAAIIRKGKPEGLRGFIIDITENKRLEAQIRQAQRMEAIGTLAGGIAHDFNNILSAIIGNAEIAATHELPKEHPALYSIEQVIMAAERASSLVKQILAFSRQSEQEFDRISVTPIIKEVSKLLRASLPSTIDIRLDLKAEKDMIVSEPASVHQILMNLCTNAAHAMRKNGGVLSIKTTEFELNPDSISNYPDLKPGSYLELTIQDTGPGMSPEVMERIFEPYFTTKQKGEGTGLGLAVIHGIVNSLKGTITVNSALNKGSGFIVRLPVLSGKPLIKGGEKASLTRGNEKILLVDDEEQLTGMGKRMLQRLGYTVFTENSSTEALKIFRNDPYGFDIIITDMTMPNMTGDKLAIEMMNIRPDIPIILCTGFSESITDEQAKEIGIREFIMKPMVLSDLSEKIRRVLGD